LRGHGLPSRGRAFLTTPLGDRALGAVPRADALRGASRSARPEPTGGALGRSCYGADVAIDVPAPERNEPIRATEPITARWLGRIDYREALALQRRLVAERADDVIGDQLLLLEHPAVLTLGRNSDPSHILASPAELVARGIEVIAVERGGEVTYHGPGQLVAYPIVALSRRGLMILPLVRALEAALVATCAAHGVGAARRDGHPGCWCDAAGPEPRKIGALGLRVERGVTYHGIALNVTVDLADFKLIDPCGIPGVVSTSIAAELGEPEAPPTTESVERAAGVFARALAATIGVPLEGV
jgi:lipoyl(octanoyl) transferase